VQYLKQRASDRKDLRSANSDSRRNSVRAAANQKTAKRLADLGEKATVERIKKALSVHEVSQANEGMHDKSSEPNLQTKGMSISGKLHKEQVSETVRRLDLDSINS
jgi:hypothetical protein